MKIPAWLAATVLFSLSAIANAGFQFGVKAGTMQIGFDEVEVTEAPNSVGLTLGYDFERSPFGVEAEVTRTVTSGTVIGTSLDVESQGLYLTYTTSGTWYVSGRVGYMDAGLVAKGLSEDEGGETSGLAFGRKLGSRLRIELDYTAIDDDISFLNISLRY